MKQNPRTTRTTGWVAGCALAAVVVGLSAAQAQEAPQPPGAPGAPRPQTGMRGGMTGDRQAMMATMQAQAKKLDDLVAAMNAAGDADKANRVAAVVLELVAQHKAMHARMMTMMAGGGMMQGRGAAPAAAQPAAPVTPGTHDLHH